MQSEDLNNLGLGVIPEYVRTDAGEGMYIYISIYVYVYIYIHTYIYVYVFVYWFFSYNGTFVNMCKYL
jgi:hypothetical protein